MYADAPGARFDHAHQRDKHMPLKTARRANSSAEGLPCSAADPAQPWGLRMPVAKIHVLEGQYNEGPLDKVSGTIQIALRRWQGGGSRLLGPIYHPAAHRGR